MSIFTRIAASGSLAALLFISGCASTPTALGNWTTLGYSANGAVLSELDRDSVRKTGSSVSFRDKKTLQSPHPGEPGRLPPHKTIISQWEGDCATHAYHLVSSDFYDASAKLTAHQEIHSPAQRAQPGSLAQKQLEFACRR